MVLRWDALAESTMRRMTRRRGEAAVAFPEENFGVCANRFGCYAYNISDRSSQQRGVPLVDMIEVVVVLLFCGFESGKG